MKFIVITGGVISGLGKGITASSIGLLLKSRGINVTSIKIDPYLNMDAGTMSPYEHGECYVLEDGGECDLDLGNYERFLDIRLTKNHNITTGKIYNSVITKERKGKYLGKTVQIIPHITDEIKNWIGETSKINVDKNKKNNPDVCIIEVGGTIGDMENLPFIEAISQMSMSDNDQFCFVHVSMLLFNNSEIKTKPTQQNISKLRSLGIFPNILVLRSKEKNISKNILEKISTYCQVNINNIIINYNVPNIYYVPDVFENQNIFDSINNKLKLNYNNPNLSYYYKIIDHYNTVQNSNNKIYQVGIIGKYTNSSDTYLSLVRAIEHASFYLNKKINIQHINSDNITNKFDLIKNLNYVIIPGGFGNRGVQGKMNVLKFCRGNNIPTLGICLGMQLMIIEYAQFLGYNVSSSEWEDIKDNSYSIIDISKNQDPNNLGGTMRLGNYKTCIDKNSLVYTLYNKEHIYERHRHRYEFNKNYLHLFENTNMFFSGKSFNNTSNSLIEICEIINHPFYIGCQYHPEYNSFYNKPHPLFVGLLSSQ